jgi:capsular polysaccharide transport system permease protein
MHYGRSFKLMVLLPFALTLLYYVFIASDRYVSESRVTVKQSGGNQDVTSIAAGLLTGGSPSSREDNLVLKDYILSLDMLNYLDTAIELRQSYQQQGDYFSRLWPWASQEDFYKHYLKRVEITYDDLTGALIIRTQGYRADFARRMNAAIMHQSEKFINDSSHKIAEEQLRFITGELKKANDELLAARQKLLGFQNRYNVLDPVEKAKALSAFVLQLESDIARQETELKHLRTFLAENSAQVVTLRDRLLAMKQQLAEEKQKISGGQSGKLNTISSQYMLLQFQAEFALDKYKAALSAYEKTRVEASRKVKNLMVISSPHQQQEAEYPRRAYILLTVLLGLLILFGISRLIIATIEDHKD